MYKYLFIFLFTLETWAESANECRISWERPLLLYRYLQIATDEYLTWVQPETWPVRRRTKLKMKIQHFLIYNIYIYWRPVWVEIKLLQILSCAMPLLPLVGRYGYKCFLLIIFFVIFNFEEKDNEELSRVGGTQEKVFKGKVLWIML